MWHNGIVRALLSYGSTVAAENRQTALGRPEQKDLSVQTGAQLVQLVVAARHTRQASSGEPSAAEHVEDSVAGWVRQHKGVEPGLVHQTTLQAPAVFDTY